MSSSQIQYTLDDFAVENARKLVDWAKEQNGQPSALAGKVVAAFETLSELLEAHERVLKRNEEHEAVWAMLDGSDHKPGVSSLESVRRKLENPCTSAD